MTHSTSLDELDDGDRAGALLMQVVEKQILQNSPPETVLTLERLVAQGESREDAVRLMAACLSVEVLDALENRSPYDEQRYTENLRRLPQLPFDRPEQP